jgi:hypothetical protein
MARGSPLRGLLDRVQPPVWWKIAQLPAAMFQSDPVPVGSTMNSEHSGPLVNAEVEGKEASYNHVPPSLC